jgi:hypothetical protein
LSNVGQGRQAVKMHDTRLLPPLSHSSDLLLPREANKRGMPQHILARGTVAQTVMDVDGGG